MSFSAISLMVEILCFFYLFQSGIFSKFKKQNILVAHLMIPTLTNVVSRPDKYAIESSPN